MDVRVTAATRWRGGGQSGRAGGRQQQGGVGRGGIGGGEGIVRRATFKV